MFLPFFFPGNFFLAVEGFLADSQYSLSGVEREFIFIKLQDFVDTFCVELIQTVVFGEERSKGKVESSQVEES